MAILAALQSASIRLMGQRPTSFFGSSQNFEMELTDLANEVAQDVAKSHDWQALTRVHTLEGDGVETTFALPDDYDRQLVVSDMQNPAGWPWGYQAIGDINQFIYREERGFAGFPGGWIIYGGEMRFVPAPTEDATFPYISKNYARDTSTLTNKAAFTNDADEFLLPERLLTLGLVWRWRENKKLDYTGDQEAFMKAISEYAAKDRGSRVFRRGSGRSFRGNLAWPWALGGA